MIFIETISCRYVITQKEPLERVEMKKRLPLITDKGVFFVAISQFGMTFSYNFIMVFMPFYILKISPFGPKETMLWTGLIMGAPPVVTALMAPFWGRLTYRFRPKLLLEHGIIWNGVLFLLFGFAQNLYLLFLLRFVLGFVGGVSTIGLVLISALSPKERLHKDMSLFQIAMTTGQLIAPPIGAYMVILVGYRQSFVIASLIIGSFFIFCHRHVKDIPCQKINPNPGKPLRKGIFWGWVLALVASIHITYIPSILPHILEKFQLREGTALNSAGMIMMAYTVTAILGNYLINNFVPRAGLRRAVMYVGLSAAFFQAVMYFGNGVFSFTLIRMLQMGVIAAVFPMILAVFASGVGGGTLGFLNSARFAGNAIGPFMATFVVAYSNLLTLYLIITGLTLVALTAFLQATKVGPSVEREK
jgi:DHA1 family multidrug resistance protein-like MFS transporter